MSEKHQKTAEIIKLSDQSPAKHPKNAKKVGDGLKNPALGNENTDLYPDKPDILQENAEKYWNVIKTAYQSTDKNEFLTALEQYTLARYCNWLVHYSDAEEKVDESGATQTTENGYEAVTGSFTVLERVDSRLSKLERQLGFTPAARKAIISSDNINQGDLFAEELASL